MHPHLIAIQHVKCEDEYLSTHIYIYMYIYIHMIIYEPRV